jgi:hypothetical protein
MNLSDRDTKIILILLIIALVALPYVLYVKDTRLETENIKAENTGLEERLAELQEMNQNREFYLSETERLHKERDEMIASYPADIHDENTTMLALAMETESEKLADKSVQTVAYDTLTDRPGMLGIDGNVEVYITAMAFGENDMYPISSEDAAEKLYGVTGLTAMNYECFYGGFKYMLEYLQPADGAGYPMNYPVVEMEYDNTTGGLTGTLTLEQYAIAGLGRTLEVPEITPKFDYGNGPDGIVGPLDQETLRENVRYILMTMQRAANAEANPAAADGDGDGDGDGDDGDNH